MHITPSRTEDRKVRNHAHIADIALTRHPQLQAELISQRRARDHHNISQTMLLIRHTSVPPEIIYILHNTCRD